jgi:neurotransmitter:Na+ symporter, NSS family
VTDGENAFESFFGMFVGATETGWAYWHPLESPLIFVAIAFVLNFILIYRGITRGIEWFCRWALPLLVLLAIVILVRVLTLGAPVPGQPEQNVWNGLGYMWNPSHQVEKLAPADRNVRAVIAPGVSVAVPISATAPQEYRELRVLQPERFIALLQETGWTPPAPQRPLEPGRWAHAGSRVRIDVSDGQALLSTPGFIESLLRPRIWLAAAGQIFFSLSVGFGVIVTYASYMRRDDDVALSSVTAAAGNGFCEVVLAGLTIIPAGFIFLGAGFVANPPGTFGMGFVALPNVFNAMEGGRIFGFLFFFLLFLAAMTSTISLLQPAIAFFEEGLGLSRRASVALLGLITAVGAGFVVFFSMGFVAIDTIDFWTANVGIVLLATIAVIMYGWVLGIDQGMQELRHGAEIPVPGFIRYIIKYVAPLFLIVVFVAWFYDEFGGRVRGIVENPPVGMAVGFMLIVLIFFLLLIGDGVRRWRGRPLREEVSR